MTIRLLQHTKPLAGIAALSLLVACSSDLTGGNRHLVQLSFTTRRAASASQIGVASDLLVGPGGELVLKRVQLVFSKIELDRTGTADCVGDFEDEDDDHWLSSEDHNGRMDEECEVVIRDPLLVDLRGDELQPVIKVPLPAGEFSQLEAKLAPAKRRFVTFNTDNPDLVGKSVRVEGTFRRIVGGITVDDPFVFTSRVRAKLEMEFDQPLIIDATTKNATVNVDVRNWFLTSTGAVIDPATAAPGSLNLARIESNIRRSFHAFEDDHERGEDRHEGHGS